MRQTTVFTLKISLAISLAIILRLSPLVTAANASASLMPALIRTSSSTPLPITVWPLNCGSRRWKESLLWSMTDTVCPALDIMLASIAPTRPHPRITIFMSCLHDRSGGYLLARTDHSDKLTCYLILYHIYIEDALRRRRRNFSLKVGECRSQLYVASIR